MSTVLSCFPIFYTDSVLGYAFIIGVVASILYKLFNLR